MTKEHLINNTYQVIDNGNVVFQGSESDCNIYISHNSISAKYEEYKSWLNEIPEISDEEIKAFAMGYYDNNGADYYVELGAKWYREQLKITN